MICHDAPMGPLDGVKVVDLSVMISGPLTGMMLADQGADVVKVESPGLGDMMRFLGSQKGGITGIFANNNRGKRSLVVDLKQPAGLEVLQKLVADADVLIQNFRPGAMERLGLGYDDLSAINPDLIYVSISGYGPDGPNSHRRVYDNVIQAASGLASVQTDPATGAPSLFRTLLQCWHSPHRAQRCVLVQWGANAFLLRLCFYTPVKHCETCRVGCLGMHHC